MQTEKQRKMAEYMRAYRQKNLEKERKKDRIRCAKRRKTKEYKEYHKKYRKEKHKEIAKQQKHYYIKNREKIRKKQNKYSKSERGRELNRKAVSKYRAIKQGKFQRHKEYCRRKQYGYNKICDNVFPDCIDVEWHHVDNDHIIALPNKIHQETTGTNDIERHRKLALGWIEYFYPNEIYNRCKRF